jgi:hypothetical protein
LAVGPQPLIKASDRACGAQRLDQYFADRIGGLFGPRGCEEGAAFVVDRDSRGE